MRTRLLPILVAAAALAVPAAAQAAPVNDNFASAIALPSAPGSSPSGFSFSTIGATGQAGEPTIYVGGSVWYRWTPTVSGGARIGACGTGVEAQIFTGTSVNALTDVGGGAAQCSGDRGVLAKAGTTYRIQVTDRPGLGIPAGRTGQLTIEQVTTMPDATIGGTKPVTAGGGSFTIAEATGAKSPQFKCDIDGKTGPVQCFNDGSGFKALFSGLSHGPHMLTVGVRDWYGNEDPLPQKFFWTVDAKTPDTTITSNTPLPSSEWASIAFTSGEPDSTFQCSYKGGAWSACTSPFVMPNTAGGHGLQVRAVDAVGNIDATPAQMSWYRVQPAAPKPPAPAPFVRTPTPPFYPGSTTTTSSGMTPIVRTGTPTRRCVTGLDVGKLSLRTLRRKGLGAGVTIAGRCPVLVTLKAGSRTLARTTLSSTRTVRLKPTRKALRGVRKGTRLTLTATGGGAATTARLRLP